MNDSWDGWSEPDDDRLLDQMLSHLKRLEPPLEVRIGNRTAVAAELSRLATRHRNRRLPWWRRTVSVPVPLALSLAIVFLVTCALLPATRRGSIQSTVSPGTPAQTAERAAGTQQELSSAAMDARVPSPTLEYYETATYLCGVGRLNSQSGYLIRE